MYVLRWLSMTTTRDAGTELLESNHRSADAARSTSMMTRFPKTERKSLWPGKCRAIVLQLSFSIWCTIIKTGTCDTKTPIQHYTLLTYTLHGS